MPSIAPAMGITRSLVTKKVAALLKSHCAEEGFCWLMEKLVSGSIYHCFCSEERLQPLRSYSVLVITDNKQADNANAGKIAIQAMMVLIRSMAIAMYLTVLFFWSSPLWR